ncbi:alpha/beta hydrolase fold domain-containing protein [Mycolicibacterium sp. 22603]|uniref:alpha/beta hydrolase fold domain-containing protein n=1 Tax=Mycolicibacterium sp. 22603 TaxID=3453950 RepID=UPI003F8257AF
MTAHPVENSPGPSLMRRARWLMNANHADRMLALSVASASLPIVGKQLEPLGGLAAMGVWGFRQFPELFAASAKSWFSPGAAPVRRAEREQTVEVAKDGLRGVVNPADLAGQWPAPESVPPLWNTMTYRRDVFRTSVRYGDHPMQLLDVWRPAELPREPAPVLLFIPGGAWVHGSRVLQGYAMMSHLAQQGWVCLSIDYRVAPHHRWPRHLTDVKAAIAWARANVDKFGGDRNFVALAGCSAGGHLAALAGLTPNDPTMQAELDDEADTSVDAVVGIYGRYDWEDRSTEERDRFVDFLERVVVGRKISRHPELFRAASPIARVHRGAPPFLVIHGSGDTVIPVAQARSFVDRLKATSDAPVGYVEFPGAGHGFDMTDGARTGAMAKAIGLFLDQIHRNSTARQAKAVI